MKCLVCSKKIQNDRGMDHALIFDKPHGTGFSHGPIDVAHGEAIKETLNPLNDDKSCGICGHQLIISTDEVVCGQCGFLYYED